MAKLVGITGITDITRTRSRPPAWLGRARHSVGFGLCMLIVTACVPVGLGSNPPGSQPGNDRADNLTSLSPTISITEPDTSHSQLTAQPLTPVSPPMLVEPTQTSTGTPEPSTTPAVPPDTPPRKGSFDVYLGAPDDSGLQALRWVSTSTGETVTEIKIRADDQNVVRAGQYVYFHAPGTRQPQRANTAGAIQPVTFADPPFGVRYYQFLPSATGNFVAWVSVDSASVFRISLAAFDGAGVQQISGDTLLPGETIRLLRVSNNGRRIFYDRRPASLTHQTVFNPRYDLYMVEAATGQVVHLPGEPACGQALLCDAHVSADGAYLVRTLPPATSNQPVVITNLVSGGLVGQFRPVGISSGAAFEVGYPYFTPGGELIYMQAQGAVGLQEYQLIWANLVTGEQRVVAVLGHERHRPLGWAADGVTLLTTREPDLYDTWQINVESGAIRQIAGMLFLGHIEEPPLTP